MAYTHITPGWEIEVSAHYSFDKKADRVVELIQLPREELAALEEASIKQEEAIFSRFSGIEAEWKKQAAETTAIRKAREYLWALPVEHTSNQWKLSPFGWHERSNMVYKMSYRVSENKKPDGTLINCALSWNIHYNTIRNPTPDYTGDGWKIAGQSDKRFATKEEMDRYLQGRIKAYERLFTEISPPIPAEEKRRFCVNGVLLPGYTVELTMEQRVSELMALADDEDFAALIQDDRPEEHPPEAPQEKPPRRSAPAKAHKKKHVPTR